MKENTPTETPSEAEKVILAVENSAHNAVAKVLSRKRQIFAAVAAVIVFTLLYSIISNMQEKAEDAAWKRIFVAEFTARQQTKATTLGEELQKAAPEIAGAKARFYACMLELAHAGVSKDESDWQKAASAAQKFIDDFPNNPFVTQVRLDYAAVLTNLGAYDKAAEQYKTVMASGNPEEKASARLFAALVLERSGRENEALDSYAQLAGDQSEFASIASFARLRLEEKMKAQSGNQKTPAAAAVPAPAEKK